MVSMVLEKRRTVTAWLLPVLFVTGQRLKERGARCSYDRGCEIEKVIQGEGRRDKIASE